MFLIYEQCHQPRRLAAACIFQGNLTFNGWVLAANLPHKQDEASVIADSYPGDWKPKGKGTCCSSYQSPVAQQGSAAEEDNHDIAFLMEHQLLLAHAYATPILRLIKGMIVLLRSR